MKNEKTNKNEIQRKLKILRYNLTSQQINNIDFVVLFVGLVPNAKQIEIRESLINWKRRQFNPKNYAYTQNFGKQYFVRVTRESSFGQFGTNVRCCATIYIDRLKIGSSYFLTPIGQKRFDRLVKKYF